MTRIKDPHFIEADVSALIFLSLFVLPSFLHLGSRHGGRPPLTSDLRSDVSMTRKTTGSDPDPAAERLPLSVKTTLVLQ